MNKLMGFYELKDSNLPTIPWSIFNRTTILDEIYLWTIRTAVYIGNDLNLPRAVGVPYNVAMEKANYFLDIIKDNGIVVYYPYFIAEKSGTLNVFNDKYVIEAVEADLWNLVTLSNRNVTIIVSDNDEVLYDGDKTFLSSNEFVNITSYVKEIMKMFRNELLDGKNILLEWSFAYKTDSNREPLGDKFLVFYEARTT
jgi:hypothetical protein